MMKQNSNNILFYILFFLFVFFDEFFFFILIMTGTSAENGMKTLEVVPIAGATYLMMAYDFFKGRVKGRVSNVLLFLIAIVLLYLLTQLFHDGLNPKYRSSLLAVLAESIPAAYVGTRLARSSSISMLKIDRLLPLFVIPISITLGIVGVGYAREAMLITEDESGLGYQSMSYFMSYCYAYCAYYVFFSPLKNTRIHRFFRIIMLPDMLFCALMCLVSGGRGAFVFIILISIYILYTLRKSMKGHVGYYILIIIGVSVAFLLAASYFNIWNSAGMNRVVEHLSDDTERERLYRLALQAFEESPIVGQGMGSIWYTVGYYSHNIVMDLLAETGIVGTTIFLSILLKTFLGLYRLMRYQKIAVLLSIIFLGALLKNAFSGYYLGAFKLFMMCSYIYVMNNFKKAHLRKSS